jgi:hypothetical protein
MEKVELNLIENEHQKILFIKYLDALLQKNKRNSHGASYFDNEKYINDNQIEMEINGTKSSLSIRIVSSEKGVLEYIEYDTLGDNNLHDYIRKLIQDALMQALSSAKNKFYRNYHYCYIGEQLDGEYWIKGMRIAPVHFEEKAKKWDNIERYISIELNVEAIDDLDADAVGNQLADICAARLSLLLEAGIYPPRKEHKWFLSESFRDPSILRQTGFYGYGHQTKRMPKKKEFCQAGEFDKTIHPYLYFVGGVLKLPKETRKLFDALEKSSEKVQRVFNQCCFLYQQALTAGRYHPTVQLSYLVAAVDALAESEEGKLKNFGAFVRHYSHATADPNHLIDFMHGTVRSAHFHAGEFAGGEHVYERLSTIRFSDVPREFTAHNFRECNKLLRNSIANWVVVLIANLKVDKP